jgi:murein L,D-transpeptidase YafK
VYRDEHLLALFEAGVMVSSYRAELGWNNLAHKLLQGDGATPGGRYSIVRKDGPGRSPYHRALLLDYPNAADRKALADAKLQGRVRASARSGGAIEIHGGGGRGRDWTDGCVAVTDAEIDRLFGRVGVGTPVTIVGSRDGRGEFAGLARRLGR